MLAPELIRIQEKRLANWVPPAKVNAIRGEFMRQCDALDGLVDGIINNYTACRAIFDRTQAPRDSDPWSAKRCPNNVDSNPADTSANACLTDGQIDTLRFVYSRYRFARPLANGVKSFGMWTPNTDPSGGGLIVPARYRGQEGAGDNAPLHRHLGALGVTGFLMQNLNANPLDYVEGGALDARRRQISLPLDSTNPDLKAFYKRGGKLIVVIGTNDTIASPGAQLDYYQSALKKMGRKKVDAFARLFVLPQTNHGLGGANYSVDGNGKSIPAAPIPNTFNRLGLLVDWVEKNVAPPDVRGRDRGEPQPSNVFLSGVSKIYKRSGRHSGFLYLCGTVNGSLFLSTDSGSTGLNLQNASVVVNCDLPWNPARLEQRIARSWRKHQTRSVTVIHLVSEHTIEQRMLETLSSKQALADGILDMRGRPERDSIPRRKAGLPLPAGTAHLACAETCGADCRKEGIAGRSRAWFQRYCPETSGTGLHPL